MAKKSLTITDLPPYPKLVWDDDDLNWKATIVLNSWRGFQSRGGPYGGIDSTVPSDGTVTLLVNPGDDEEETPPFAEQSAAFQHLLENEQVIHDQIVKAIFERYPKLRAKLQKQMKEMLECKMIKKKYHDEFLSQMPEISKPSELLRMMGLSHVHVLNVHHDGMA